MPDQRLSLNTAPALKTGYVTYAVFSVPVRGMPMGGVRLVPVDSRDISTIELPDDSWKFYFCDAPDKASSQDPLAEEENLSTYILIASEIVSAQDLRARLIKKGVIQDPPPPKGRRNAKDLPLTRDLQHFIHEAKLARAPWHVISPQGHAMPIDPGHGLTVIDVQKNILMGPDDTAPRKPEKPPHYPPPMNPRLKL